MALHFAGLSRRPLLIIVFFQQMTRAIRTMVVLLTLGILAAQAPAFAEGQTGTTHGTSVTRSAVTGPFTQRALAAAVGRSLERLPMSSDTARLSAAQQTVQQRSWIGRHPVLFGALVGAGAGAGIGYALGQNCTGQEIEPCSSKAGAAVVSAGLFAGGGALVGFLVDRATK
jgi:hypothetical protein